MSTESYINKFPNIGFGTDQIPEGETTINAVTWAIKAGYRLIDNADCYNNQVGVGIAIKNCIDENIVTRNELFITSKVPDWKQGYQKTIDCCMNSLKEMGLDYFDLYLVHSPLRTRENAQDTIIDTYRALEYLYKEGFVKNIGVSNFGVRHLENLLPKVNIKPIINQIEFHPQRQQRDIVNYCRENNIIIEGWGTLNQGRIFKNKVFIDIAQKHNVDPAQIAVKYSLTNDVIPLVRSTKKERIERNINIKDIDISSEEMKLLNGLDGGEFSNWHHDGLAPRKMVPIESILQFVDYPPKTYTYKLFGITILQKRILRRDKTKYYLFGIIPFLKVTRG